MNNKWSAEPKRLHDFEGLGFISSTIPGRLLLMVGLTYRDPISNCFFGRFWSYGRTTDREMLGKKNPEFFPPFSPPSASKKKKVSTDWSFFIFPPGIF